MVEIARAVRHKAKVIIFDEPTASLTPEEKQHFFALVRDLKNARRLDRLHLARARGGAADRRPHHRPARRRARWSPTTRRRSTARDRPGDGRPRSLADALRRAQDDACGKPARRVLTAQNLKMAPMVRNNSFRLRRADHRRVRAGRRRPHRDAQDRRRRAQARLLPRRRDFPATTSRCAIGCRRRRCATASST